MDTNPRIYHAAHLSNGQLIVRDVTGACPPDGLVSGIQPVEGSGLVTHQTYIVADDITEAMVMARDGFDAVLESEAGR